MKHILLSITFFLISCNSTTKKEICEIDFSENNSFIVEKSSVVYKLIPLETIKDNFLGNINKIVFFEDRIFVLDSYKSKTLQIYDFHGHFIDQIGAIGQAPGEFLTPNDFFIDKKNMTLVITDLSQNRLSYYSLNDYSFVYSKQVPFDFFLVTKVSEHHYFWYLPGGYNDNRKKFNFKITDADFNHIGYYDESFFSLNSSISCGSRIYEFNDKQYWCEPYSGLISELSENKDLSPRLLTFGTETLPPPSFLNKIKESKTDYVYECKKSNFLMCYATCETEDVIAVTYLVRMVPHIAFYHKRKTTSCKYSLKDFCGLSGIDNVNFPITSYKNYIVTAISPDSEFIKNSDLHSLKEDDNPVICLFRFK